MSIQIDFLQTAGSVDLEKLSIDLIKKHLKNLKYKKSAYISIAVIGRHKMKRLNNQYRKKNKDTDVLSFGDLLSTKQGDQWGEIFVSYDKASSQSKKYNLSLKVEVSILLTHGLLHLMGHDHKNEKDAKRMRLMERKLLGKGLIERSLYD